MSIKLMSQIWDQGPYTGTKLLLHLALADHANEEGYCWPGIATLAHKVRVTERQVQRLLREMETDGVVGIKKRHTDEGRQTSNGYYVRVTPMSGTPRHPDVTDEGDIAASPESPEESPHELPASSDAGNLDELEYVPLEGDDDYPEESEQPKWQIPETNEQKEFLAVCRAKKFKARQKTQVKALLKSFKAGDMAGLVAYQYCLDQLEGHEDLPQLPFCIPRSWYEWRAEFARDHRWSVWIFIRALMNRDALVKHCQYHLKHLGVPVPEESYEDRCRRMGWTEIEPGVWEDKR